jgi:alpha-mannosidase
MVSSSFYIFCILVNHIVLVSSTPECNLVGSYFYKGDPSVNIVFTTSVVSDYLLTCTGNCGWTHANVTVDKARSWSSALFIQFDNGITTTGWALSSCNTLRIIYFGGGSVYSLPWCAIENPNCKVPIDPQWSQPDSQIHLIEVSHSDIFWLGSQDDVEIDSRNINASLALMNVNPKFVWQHECILFLRVYVEMYGQNAEDLLISKIAEGRFDIGGTFTEGFESTMVNEILARQMYVGRKWFVERYSGLDSAVVAFHQDGPLRAIQMPQVYAKAGMRYMKPSRLAEDIVLWTGLDGKTGLISFPQWQYCEGSSQWSVDAQDILYKMSLYAPQYKAAGLPPFLPITWGCDYAPPDNATQLFSDWTELVSNGTTSAELIYSNFKNWGDAISQARSQLPSVYGERPNLWYMENAPTHHWMWSDYRDAGRLLPAAEAFSAFRGIIEGGYMNYPIDILDYAWLNISLADHGISAEPTPKGQGLPTWLVNDESPDQADQVYAEKWKSARMAAESMLTEAQGFLASSIDVTSAPIGAIASIVVFNSLSWSRSDPVLDLSLPFNNSNVAIVDSIGNPIDSQLSSDGKFLVFIATVPSFGYSTYFMINSTSITNCTKKTTPMINTPWTSPFSNDFYTITPGKGGLAAVIDLASGISLFDTTYYDVGEWMELQYTGMGASETHSYSSPWLNSSTFARLGNLSQNIGWACIENGPVRTVFSTSPLLTAHSTVRLVVEAYSTIKRLDVRVDIINWDSAFGVVNRVVFPINTNQQNISYAAPFGVVRVGLDEYEDAFHDMWLTSPGPQLSKFERAWAMRPREISDWVRCEGLVDKNIGVTISSSVGSFDWVDITNVYPSTQPVLSPEMLLHTNSNRSPFLPEPGDHHFLFSITATSSGWISGWKAGVQPNNPFRSIISLLSTRKKNTTRFGQPLSLSTSFINVTSSSLSGDTSNAWITAVKKEDGDNRNGLIVRLFAVNSEDATVNISTAWTLVDGAQTTNLIELDGQDIPGTLGATNIEFLLGHWSIETFRLGVLNRSNTI